MFSCSWLVVLRLAWLSLLVVQEALATQQDGTALCAFYGALTKPSRNLLSDWDCSQGSALNPCGSSKWSGVNCAQFGGSLRLVQLSLSGLRIYDSIPTQIGLLTSLTLLDLSTNQFWQQIPSEIGRLTLLKELSLSDNYLSGPIPAEINKLTDLQVMSLSYNYLSGSIPFLSQLVSLRILALFDNYLTAFPSSALPALVRLSIQCPRLGPALRRETTATVAQPRSSPADRAAPTPSPFPAAL